MIVHRIPTDFGLVGVVGVRIDWQFSPLAAGVQSVQNIVEHLVQRDFAHKASFSRPQKRQNVGFELVFGYPGRDGAHRCLPLARVFSDDALSLPSLKSLNQFIM